MARRLRVIGSTSGVGDCPTLYEDVDTGEVVVQGYAVTDPEDVAQLMHVKDAARVHPVRRGNSPVPVPR
ncbi:hypothetical protein [Kitasatospora sp. NPDC056731]|uniref:hypothetical protein n=1 Tax=Kitasatospora sp. NPDC056731 TaxID=3155422 RepID=UPI00341663CA